MQSTAVRLLITGHQGHSDVTPVRLTYLCI